jgi:hypothetical protein
MKDCPCKKENIHLYSTWTCHGGGSVEVAELGCTNFGFGLLERVEVIASRGEYSAMTRLGLQKPAKGSDGFPRHDQEKK